MSISYPDKRTRLPEVATHLFRIGQMVRMTSRFGIPPGVPEFYRVTRTLPARDTSPQYRIRNDNERHERVVTEDSLKPAGEPSPHQLQSSAKER